MKKPSILLFDIDGTILDTGGAGRRSMEHAFAKTTGRKDACSFPFDGMTDRGIARKGLEAAGRDVTEDVVVTLLDAYLEALASEVINSPGFVIHPGVRETIEQASNNSTMVTGLGTGNMKRGAQIKLNRAGLFERFVFGGFGCDHEDRAELLRVGAERGAKVLGKQRAHCRVVVIGDTPKDIAAAIAIGAESLAVATGRFGAAELENAGATRVVKNLLEGAAAEMLFG